MDAFMRFFKVFFNLIVSNESNSPKRSLIKDVLMFHCSLIEKNLIKPYWAPLMLTLIIIDVIIATFDFIQYSEYQPLIVF